MVDSGASPPGSQSMSFSFSQETGRPYPVGQLRKLRPGVRTAGSKCHRRSDILPSKGNLNQTGVVGRGPDGPSPCRASAADSGSGLGLGPPRGLEAAKQAQFAVLMGAFGCLEPPHTLFCEQGHRQQKRL